MRRPRVRIWMLMVGVTVVTIPIGLLARRDRLSRISAAHSALVMKDAEPVEYRGVKRGRPFWPTPLGEWHLRMEQKYEHAARYPWLPVEPDPPQPK
jgi:hypothetical protein